MTEILCPTVAFSISFSNLPSPFFCRNCFYNSLEPAISFLLSSLLSHVSVRLEVPVKSPRLRGRVTFSLWKSGRRIGSAGKDELGWKSNLRRGYG